jgi:hypothetical protein
VSVEGDKVTIHPYKNAYPRMGFTPIKGGQICIAVNSTAEELGAAIQAALDAAT